MSQSGYKSGKCSLALINIVDSSQTLQVSNQSYNKNNHTT